MLVRSTESLFFLTFDVFDKLRQVLSFCLLEANDALFCERVV